MRIRIQKSDITGVYFLWQATDVVDTSSLWIQEPWLDYIVIKQPDMSPKIITRDPGTKPMTLPMSNATMYGVRLSCSQSGRGLLNRLVAANCTQSLEQIKSCIAANNQSVRGTRKRSNPLSQRQVARNIKKITGLPMSQLLQLYTLHQFIAQECSNAAYTQKLTDNIDYSHFYDQPHFNRIFKKFTSLGPREFFSHYSGLPEQLMSISYNYWDSGCENIMNEGENHELHIIKQ